jgi:D-alanyl-D-alanine carboxypeptidase
MDKMNTTIEKILAQNQIFNADVAFILDNRLWSHTFMNREVNQPPESFYLVYSIAKTLIAAAIMRLAEENKLELDGPLSEYFSPYAALQGVTIRQVLNHTAGLPDYGPLPSYLKALVADPLKPWTFEEYLERTLSQRPAAAKPGQFYYSNLGYALLKNLIPIISGTDFDQFMIKTMIEPQKLAHTWFLKDPADLHRILPSMTYSVVPGGEPVDIRYHYHPGWVAHGLLASTAIDIATFFNALFEGRVVSEHSLQAMLEGVPVQNPLFPGKFYGLGLMGAVIPAGRLWGHSGGGPGFMAVGYHLTGPRPLTIAILTNNEMAFSLEKAMLAIIQAVLD